LSQNTYNANCSEEYHAVRPCHHGMERLQVADEGTTSNMKDSCVRIADKGRSSTWDMGEVLTVPHCKQLLCYEKNAFVFGLGLTFGTTQAM